MHMSKKDHSWCPEEDVELFIFWFNYSYLFCFQNIKAVPEAVPAGWRRTKFCRQPQAIIPLLGVLVSSAVYPQVVIVKLMLLLCISTGGS